MSPLEAVRPWVLLKLALALLLWSLIGCGGGEKTAPPASGLLRFLPGVAGDWQVRSAWHDLELPSHHPEDLTRPCFRADFEADTVGQPPASWTPVENAEQLGIPDQVVHWPAPTVEAQGQRRAVKMGIGPGALARLVPVSPLSTYVLNAWVRPGAGQAGLLLVPLRADPPDGPTTAAHLARLFGDPDQHTLAKPYLLTPEQRAPPESKGDLHIEVVDTRDGFQQWRFEFPAPTSFGTRSLLIAIVNGLDGDRSPPWYVDEIELHEIPARAGMGWKPGFYWGLPDAQMMDLTLKTALVRRDWDSRQSLLLVPGSEVEAALEIPSGSGTLHTSLCLVEEDRLIRDGPCQQTVRVTLQDPAALAGVDRLTMEQDVELSWESGQIAAWSDVQFPLMPAEQPRTLILRVEVAGEDRPDAPLIALSMVRWVPALPAEVERPPNVVLVSLDTFRLDRLGRTVNGQSLTPNLDALCEQSIVFHQALAPASYTLPSHVSMFTGQRPAVHGLLNPVNVFRPEVSRCFTEQLADAGYSTGAFTSGAMLNAEYCAVHRGFDQYSEIDPLLSETDPLPDSVPRWYQEEYNQALFEANRLDRRVVPWIEQNADTPFFLFLHSYLVHNYHPGESLREQYEVRPDVPVPVEAGPPLWERPEPVSASSITSIDPGDPAQFVEPRDLPYLESLYDATVARADAAMGDLFRTLEEQGLTDHTIVIVVSDHGEEFCEHGGLSHARTLYEEMLRVPWILRVPGEAPRRVERAVDLSQLAATILELTGLDPDPRITACSGLREPTEARTTLHEGVLDLGTVLRSARRDRFKLIERGPRQALHETDLRALSPQAEQSLAALGYVEGGADLPSEVTWELYDLDADREERHNLLDDLPPNLKTVLLRLRQELAHD